MVGHSVREATDAVLVVPDFPDLWFSWKDPCETNQTRGMCKSLLGVKRAMSYQFDMDMHWE